MKKRKIPARMCVSCREMKPKKDLIRIVRSPEGAVAIDESGRAPGRGAYICANAECARQAEKRRAVEKNLDAGDCGLLYSQLAALCAERAKPAEGATAE